MADLALQEQAEALTDGRWPYVQPAPSDRPNSRGSSSRVRVSRQRVQLLSDTVLLERERNLFRMKQQHLEDEDKRLQQEISRMEREIEEYTHRASKLPKARYKRGGNKMKREQLLISPALAEVEKHRTAKQVESLKDKLQLLHNKHNDMLAVNRKLRMQVEDLRRVKLHQNTSMSFAHSVAERTGVKISAMITSAQRAYAEQEAAHARVAEVREHAEQRRKEHAHALGRIDAETREIEAAEAEREKEVEALEKECQQTVAMARAEEERRAKVQAQYKAIVDKRVRYQDGLDEIISTLRVKSVSDLMAAYTMTAAKILSLWDRHAEQEAELERLEGELRELNVERAEFEEQQHALEMERLAAEHDSDEDGGGGGGSAVSQSAHSSAKAQSVRAAKEARLFERLRVKEALSQRVCATVHALAQSIPAAWHLLTAEDDQIELTCGSHNVLSFFAAVESIVAAQVLSLRREQQRAVLAAQEAAEEVSASDALVDAQAAADAAALAHDGERKGTAPRDARRQRTVTVTPPTMEGIITRDRSGDEVNVFVGLGERRFGRKSLRSELMLQIREGVAEQREKMAEEKILIQIGERKPEASTRAEIDTTLRDRSIDSWLHRRGKSDSAPPSTAGSFGGKPLAKQRSLPGASRGSTSRASSRPHTGNADVLRLGAAPDEADEEAATPTSAAAAAAAASPPSGGPGAAASSGGARSPPPIGTSTSLVESLDRTSSMSHAPLAALRDGPRKPKPVDQSSVVDRLHASRNVESLAVTEGASVSPQLSFTLLPRSRVAHAQAMSAEGSGVGADGSSQLYPKADMESDIKQLNARLTRLAQQREYLRLIREAQLPLSSVQKQQAQMRAQNVIPMNPPS